MYFIFFFNDDDGNKNDLQSSSDHQLRIDRLSRKNDFLGKTVEWFSGVPLV